MMWLSLAKLALRTGSEVYKNRKETKVLQSIAERKQMQRVIDGEIEMVNTVKTHQANDLKDEIVLIIISIPLLVCAWGIFSNDADIIIKLDAFFDQVMVMAEDTAVRENRLALLNQTRALFLEIADISLLQA